MHVITVTALCPGIPRAPAARFSPPGPWRRAQVQKGRRGRGKNHRPHPNWTNPEGTAGELPLSSDRVGCSKMLMFLKLRENSAFKEDLILRSPYSPWSKMLQPKQLRFSLTCVPGTKAIRALESVRHRRRNSGWGSGKNWQPAIA